MLKAESPPFALDCAPMMEETESNGESSVDWDNLTFSFTETDRMYIATCKQGEEWEPGIMQDFQDLKLSPAAGVINYGQGLFEGMKARRSEDGRVLLFRPELNARRAQDGCKRLGMPSSLEAVQSWE